MERPWAWRWVPGPRAERGAQWAMVLGQEEGKGCPPWLLPWKAASHLGSLQSCCLRQGSVRPSTHSHPPRLGKRRGQWGGLSRMGRAHSRAAAEPRPVAAVPGLSRSCGWAKPERTSGPSWHSLPSTLCRAVLRLTVMNPTRKPVQVLVVPGPARPGPGATTPSRRWRWPGCPCPLSMAGAQSPSSPCSRQPRSPWPGGVGGFLFTSPDWLCRGKKTYGSSQNARQRATNAFYKNGYI